MSNNIEEIQKLGKTKKNLTKAILKLLEKNNFSKITVNDICREALVSRASFYTHFEDKYALLIFAFEENNRRMDKDLTVQESLEYTVNFIFENSNLFKNLIIENSNKELTKMLNEAFTKRISEKLLSQEIEEPKVPRNIAAIYLAGGIANLMAWWVGIDNLSLSKTEMIGHILKLIDV